MVIIDEPVRVYSSGMQMRLAFSVATAQRPDVLIVDEALSVEMLIFSIRALSEFDIFVVKAPPFNSESRQTSNC